TLRCLRAREEAPRPLIPRKRERSGSPLSRGRADVARVFRNRRRALVRPAARPMRCARDDLAGALAELSEVDGRDLAAFLEQRGHHRLVVREGPPVILTVFFCSLPVRHGNTKKFPRALLFINERSS